MYFGFRIKDDKKSKDKIVRVLKALFPGAKIILYGSRARGDAHDNSDIDIAIDAGKKFHGLILMKRGVCLKNRTLFLKLIL